MTPDETLPSEDDLLRATPVGRLVYGSHLVLLVAGVAFFTLAVGEIDARLLLDAGAFLAVSLLLRRHLVLTGRLAACVAELEPVACHFPTAPEVRAELNALLDRSSALESRRGMPDFDPWEALAVRREIAAHLRRHPPLAGADGPL